MLLHLRRFIKNSFGKQNQLFFLFVCKKTYVFALMSFTSNLKYRNWIYNWTEKWIFTVISLAENSSGELKIIVTNWNSVNLVVTFSLQLEETLLRHPGSNPVRSQAPCRELVFTSFLWENYQTVCIYLTVKILNCFLLQKIPSNH